MNEVSLCMFSDIRNQMPPPICRYMHFNSYYDDIDVKMGAAKAKWIDYSQKWMLYISILLSSFI